MNSIELNGGFPDLGGYAKQPIWLPDDVYERHSSLVPLSYEPIHKEDLAISIRSHIEDQDCFMKKLTEASVPFLGRDNYSFMSVGHRMCFLICIPGVNSTVFHHFFPDWGMEPKHKSMQGRKFARYVKTFKELGKEAYLIFQGSNFGGFKTEMEYINYRMNQLRGLKDELSQIGFNSNFLPVFNTMRGGMDLTIDKDDIVCWNAQGSVVGHFKTPKFTVEES